MRLKVEGDYTRDMRRRHRRAADRIGGSIAGIPRRSDANPRGEQVYTGAEVGKTWAGIIGLRRAYGNRGANTGGAEIAGIGIAIPSRDGKGNARLNGTGNSLI